MSGARLSRLVVQALGLAAFAAGAAYAAYLVGPPMARGPVRPIAIESRPVPLDSRDPARATLGRLRYLGGLVLKSPERAFGGLSGLLFEPGCGRLLAVNDMGSWFVLVLEEEGDRLVAVRSAFIAPIRDDSGQPPDRKYFADSEALMRDPVSGDTLVWFELDHRAQRHRGVSACAPATLATAAHAIDRPAAIRRWRSNRGVEAAAPDGRGILLLAEGEPAAGALAGGGRMAAVRIEGSESRPLAYPAPDGLLATSIAELAPGTHLLLQRRLPRLGGFVATVSLLRFAADGTGERTEIARLAHPLVVDNMEGLAIRKEGDRTFLYLVSDDNFMALQRTLLLKFELLPG